uniref:Uncharacterized protein n=1 Tax=Vitis vinifera TaxID=29760 RepID=A5CB67_VITVI|nr:hypothetical protein VITISV_013506 [Vitis vinifera]
MAFGRQLHQAEGQFRTMEIKVRIPQSKVWEFLTPQTKLIPPGEEFYPADIPPSLDVSQPDGRGGHFNFPVQTCPDPLIGYFISRYLIAGWERRTFQLSRSDMSGSSDSAYPESIRNRQIKFPGQLGSSDTRDLPDPFPPTIKKQTLIILTTNFLSSQSNSEDFSLENERLGSSSLGVKKAGCACHVEYEIAEEAMNFMSYVAEVSRGWDEPNARNMGRMTSQPDVKGEMYILNEDIDMKAKIAAMAGRLEELEMKKMQEVQAISQTPLQAMPCAICLSYEHLVEECPTIPTVREMLGDCNTYNSNWRNHPNFPWKPQPPQYKQHVQALPQASNLEQAMVNLSKVMRDFVGAQKSINVQLSQRIDSIESSLNKRMDGMQNDLSQKIDNLQYSISRFANLNTVSGKEVDLPTSKLEHEVESETEKEKSEEIKGKKKGKSTEKDDYDVNEEGEPQRIVIKEEMMKHMPPPFTQALYGKIIQTKSQVRDANFIWDPGKCLGIKIHSQKSRVKSEELVVERSLKLDALNLNGLGVIDGPPLHGQPDGRGGRFNFPGQTCADPLIGYFISGYLTAGWERRTFQLPRSDMSRSSDSTYLESIRSRQIRFP